VRSQLLGLEFARRARGTQCEVANFRLKALAFEITLWQHGRTTSSSIYVVTPYSRLSAVCPVVAFVDWNSQLRLGSSEVDSPTVDVARIAFKATSRRIADCLSKVAPTLQFRVSLRLYHGWHKGFQPTERLKAIRNVVAATDFAILSNRPNVAFTGDVSYGDRLLGALQTRLNQACGLHLPNTLRDRGDGREEEKMVDTALAADLIVSAL
jgi:hypothetical protein